MSSWQPNARGEEGGLSERQLTPVCLGAAREKVFSRAPNVEEELTLLKVILLYSVQT